MSRRPPRPAASAPARAEARAPAIARVAVPVPERARALGAAAPAAGPAATATPAVAQSTPRRTPAAAPRPADGSPQALRMACANRLITLVPPWMREIRAAMRDAAPEGLSVPLFRGLIFARKQPGGSVTELAAHLGVSVPTASVAVDKLVAAGLLDSRTEADNRRRRALFLTPDGERVVADALTHTNAVFEQRLTPLDTPALQQVLAALAVLEPLLVPGGG